MMRRFNAVKSEQEEEDYLYIRLVGARTDGLWSGAAVKVMEDSYSTIHINVCGSTIVD